MKGLHCWNKNSIWNKHQSSIDMKRTNKSVISPSFLSSPFFFTHSFFFLFFVLSLFFTKIVTLDDDHEKDGDNNEDDINSNHLFGVYYLPDTVLSILPKLVYLIAPQILGNRCYSEPQFAEVETES